MAWVRRLWFKSWCCQKISSSWNLLKDFFFIKGLYFWSENSTQITLSQITETGQNRHLKLINIIANKDENGQKNLCRCQGSNSRLCAAVLCCCERLFCLALFWLIGDPAPWYCCWVIGLLEAIVISMARVQTRPVQESIHPNNTGFTARPVYSRV